MAKKLDLAAAIGGAVSDSLDLPDSGMTREIPVDDILDNPRNFYPRPDNNALGALIESIQANGLLEPPAVVPTEDGKYRLISGHNRMAAVRLLAANKDESVARQFAAVLCRVLPAMTEEQEECAVIEANRQRVKSNALLAQEAEKLKENYIRRKKAGENFPVGLRDWIAKEMQINATKVGNLQVIKKGLKVPGIIARWEAGELPEAAALEIARMDDETQYRLLDWTIDNSRTWTINNVREFRTCWTCCKHECPDTGGFCPNSARMYAERYRNGEWRCSGCCRECLSRDTCPTACHFVVAERPQKEPETVAPRNPAADDPAPKPPTLFSVELCAPVWQPLDPEHWPAEGSLVVLSYETGLGGSGYLVVRCAGGPEEDYPFISTDAGTSVDYIIDCQCDQWMPLAECKRGVAKEMNGGDEHE